MPERTIILAALGLSLLLCVAAILPAQAQEGRRAGYFNHTDIAKAEEIIKEYVYEHYAWGEDAYGIYIEEKKRSHTGVGHIIQFYIYYRDDDRLFREMRESGIWMRGRVGKSFYVVFDMNKMEVVQRLYPQ